MTSENRSCSIPEEVLINMRLNEIFIPNFSQQRESTFQKNENANTDVRFARFVHYTTAESALSIIENKELWLRQTGCMSDYLEVQHGYDILYACFSDSLKRDAFFQALDACAPGAAKEALELFDHHFSTVKSSTFISSISEHSSGEEDQHGRLSMWRAYGGNTGRVAIIFKLPWYEEGIEKAVNKLNIKFGPVSYSAGHSFNDEFGKTLFNIEKNREWLCSVGRDKIVNNIFNMLLMNTVCLKHSGFKEEKEWRIIHFPHIWASPLMKPEIKVIGGVPQKIYKLPLDSSKDEDLSGLDFTRIFDSLIIGPTQYSWPMFNAFADALAERGIQDSSKRIYNSFIPIR